MENQVTIPMELIPDVVQNIRLTEDQKKVISLTGELPLKAVYTPSGFKEGHLVFIVDDSDPAQPKLHHDIMYEDQYKMIIPDAIGNKPVNKQALQAGQEDGPFKLGGKKDAYISMDSKTGKTNIRIPGGFKIPHSIGNYKFNKEEKFLLEQGASLKEPIVYQRASGEYVSVLFQCADGKNITTKAHRVLNQSEVNNYKAQIFTRIENAESPDQAKMLFEKIAHLSSSVEKKLFDQKLKVVEQKAALKPEAVTNDQQKDTLKTQAEVSDLKRATGKEKDDVKLSPQTKKEEKMVLESEKTVVRNAQEDKVDRVKKKMKEKTIGLPKRKSNDLGR